MSKVICPYCTRYALYVKKCTVIKASKEGMLYICKPCNAWARVIPGTDQPYGQLANGVLREARKYAHVYVDHMWKRKAARGKSASKARDKIYKWLSKEMDLPREETHIGLFNMAQCMKVIEICKPYCL